MAQEQKKYGKYELSTVVQSFKIVEWLSESDGATVTETARELDLPKSTAFVHLKTLERIGYLANDDGIYKPSYRFLSIGCRRRREFPLYDIARKEVEQLAEETGEVVDLATHENGKRVLLYKVMGEQGVSDNTVIGDHAHMHCSALGQAMLAYFSKERVDEIVQRYGLPARTNRSITVRAELDEKLEDIRERGYTYNDEEWERGIRGVAAPIRDEEGRPVGSISITGPRNQLEGDYFREELPNKLLRHVNIIEIKLTHS